MPDKISKADLGQSITYFSNRHRAVIHVVVTTRFSRAVKRRLEAFVWAETKVLTVGPVADSFFSGTNGLLPSP